MVNGFERGRVFERGGIFMRTASFTSLPTPLALALYNYQMETPVHSADELAELITALVEYLAVVALMDYFDGHSDPAHNGSNENLNGWVISQLIFGKRRSGSFGLDGHRLPVQDTRTRIPCSSNLCRNKQSR